MASEPARLEDLRRNLLLCYTGKVRRNVGLIDTQIELFRSGREETLLGMKQLVEMAYAMRGVIEARRRRAARARCSTTPSRRRSG